MDVLDARHELTAGLALLTFNPDLGHKVNTQTRKPQPLLNPRSSSQPLGVGAISQTYYGVRLQAILPGSLP